MFLTEEDIPIQFNSATDISCATKEYKVFMWMEFGLKSIPSILFFILGTARYIETINMGVSAYKFSRHFQTKCAISIMMGVANTLYIIICYSVKPSTLQSWINKCNDDNFSLFYGL